MVDRDEGGIETRYSRGMWAGSGVVFLNHRATSVGSGVFPELHTSAHSPSDRRLSGIPWLSVRRVSRVQCKVLSDGPSTSLLSSPMSALIRFLKNEDGPTAVEYAVMLAMIMLAIMTSVRLLQARTGATYDKIGTELNNAGF